MLFLMPFSLRTVNTIEVFWDLEKLTPRITLKDRVYFCDDYNPSIVSFYFTWLRGKWPLKEIYLLISILPSFLNIKNPNFYLGTLLPS